MSANKMPDGFIFINKNLNLTDGAIRALKESGTEFIRA